MPEMPALPWDLARFCPLKGTQRTSMGVSDCQGRNSQTRQLEGWRSQERGGSNPPFRTSAINNYYSDICWMHWTISVPVLYPVDAEGGRYDLDAVTSTLRLASFEMLYRRRKQFESRRREQRSGPI